MCFLSFRFVSGPPRPLGQVALRGVHRRWRPHARGQREEGLRRLRAVAQQGGARSLQCGMQGEVLVFFKNILFL